MPTTIDPKLQRKAEAELRKMGAVLVPIVLRMFVNEFGDKIASGNTEAFWEAIDEFRTSHGDKFSPTNAAPDLMTRNSRGNFVHSLSEGEQVAKSQLALLGQKPLPVVDLMAKNEDGTFKVKDVHATEESLLRHARSNG